MRQARWPGGAALNGPVKTIAFQSDPSGVAAAGTNPQR